MFSRTVPDAITASCGAYATSWRASQTAEAEPPPSARTSSPSIASRRAVFPEPTSPMTAISSPSRTLRLTASRALPSVSAGSEGGAARPDGARWEVAGVVGEFGSSPLPPPLLAASTPPSLPLSPSFCPSLGSASWPPASFVAECHEKEAPCKRSTTLRPSGSGSPGSSSAAAAGLAAASGASSGAVPSSSAAVAAMAAGVAVRAASTGASSASRRRRMRRRETAALSSSLTMYGVIMSGSWSSRSSSSVEKATAGVIGQWLSPGGDEPHARWGGRRMYEANTAVERRGGIADQKKPCNALRYCVWRSVVSSFPRTACTRAPSGASSPEALMPLAARRISDISLVRSSRRFMSTSSSA
mmetsp:Transcript_40604/g.131455  ORF Transcript_40604/g.131455 Transcript_40604/m.131455 type:complete len:358 (+) Transcript_40604:2610-3683(+)